MTGCGSQKVYTSLTLPLSQAGTHGEVRREHSRSACPSQIV